VEGTVLDPADASIPNASVHLKDRASSGAALEETKKQIGIMRSMLESQDA